MTDDKGILRRARIMTTMYVIGCVILAGCAVLNFLIKFSVLPYSPTYEIGFGLAILMTVALNGYSYYSRKKGGGYASSVPLKIATYVIMFAWVISLVVLKFIG